jgi:hypothetical protein
MSVDYGVFLDSLLNAPSITHSRTRNQFSPGAILVTFKRTSLLAALAFALPIAALVSAPAMAATHKKAPVVRHHVHKASTHKVATHTHKPRPARVAVH